MHIDDEGNRYIYSPGDRVAVRNDLLMDENYYSIHLDCYGHRVFCEWNDEKEFICFNIGKGVVTIKNCEEGYYEIEEDKYNDWYFVDTMFVGLADECDMQDIPVTALDEILL